MPIVFLLSFPVDFAPTLSTLADAEPEADPEESSADAWCVRVCVNEGLPEAEVSVLRSLRLARVWGQLVVFPYEDYEDPEPKLSPRAEDSTALQPGAADKPSTEDAAPAPRPPIYISVPPDATPLSLPFPPPSPRALHQLRVQLSYLPSSAVPLSLLPPPPPQAFSEAVLAAPSMLAHSCASHQACPSSSSCSAAATSPTAALFSPPVFSGLLARALGHARASVVHLAPDLPHCTAHRALAGAMALLLRPPVASK